MCPTGHPETQFLPLFQNNGAGTYLVEAMITHTHMPDTVTNAVDVLDHLILLAALTGSNSPHSIDHVGSRWQSEPAQSLDTKPLCCVAVSVLSLAVAFRIE